MDSLLRDILLQINAAYLLAIILVAAAAGIGLLLLSVFARRAWRHFQTRRFDALSIQIH